MRLLLFGILWLGASCDPCRRMDCAPPFDDFQFIYVDTNGENLLGGNSPKYELDDIKIYSTGSNRNKVFANLYLTSTSDINVQLTYSTERSFLEVKGKVTDTLDFEFKMHKSECCGEISEIDETILNGIVYNGNFPIEIIERN